jgi:uncharacterized protein with PQ loop repeat
MTHFFYSSKKKRMAFLDDMGYVAVLLGIVMTVPQILTIWVEHKVEGVSVVTWASYCVLTVFWIYYGVIHKEKPIILGNVLGLMVNISVVLGIFLLR